MHNFQDFPEILLPALKIDSPPPKCGVIEVCKIAEDDYCHDFREKSFLNISEAILGLILLFISRNLS